MFHLLLHWHEGYDGLSSCLLVFLFRPDGKNFKFQIFLLQFLEVVDDLHGQGNDGGDGDEPEEDIVRFGTVVSYKTHIVRDDMPDEVGNDENAMPDAAEPAVFLSRLDVANPHGKKAGDCRGQDEAEKYGK